MCAEVVTNSAHIMCGCTQTSGVVLEMTKAEVARLANQAAEHFAAVIMIDMEAEPLAPSALADRASTLVLECIKDARHVVLEAEVANGASPLLELEQLRVLTFPATGCDLAQMSRLASVALTLNFALALEAVRSGLRVRAGTDSEELHPSTAFADCAALCLADSVTTGAALDGDAALWVAALAQVVRVPHDKDRSTGLGPECARRAS